MNGLKRIVTNRSFGFSIILALIIPGTLHPKPITNGINALPFKPIFDIPLSIINAALAIYPESSRKEIIKNKINICGINTKTPPTPAIIPLTINCISQSLIPNAISELVVQLEIGPLNQPSRISCKGPPTHEKVI